jgi:hypothetical protein
MLANTRLLNELKAGTWDGQNLDEKLLQFDQEDQQHYTFYPHDPRMFQNRQGAWEATGERQITLPLSLEEELNTFKEPLHAHWSALHAPLTVGQILAILEELGWTHDSITSVHRCIRAWLLTNQQFRRVGPDYWMLAEQLPPEVQRTRLQVLPVRMSALATGESIAEEENPATSAGQDRKRQEEQITFRGTATKTQVAWTTTLLSIHLIEGFIPVPKSVRGIYPPTSPGEEGTSVLKGLWHEDATELWIWLDRTHHRLYGPDLLDKIGFLPAGLKLRIEWNTDQIVMREAGLDQDVQREETRLVDLEELKRLRGGPGESYRQAIQAILMDAPDGLTFKEIVVALSQRQSHQVTRRTIRSILSGAGFIQRERRWFAAPDAMRSAKQLREALLETLVPQAEEGEQKPMSHNEYVRTRVAAIHQRLQEITEELIEKARF